MKGFDQFGKRRPRVNRNIETLIYQLDVARNELLIINYINASKKRRKINLT